MLKLKNYKPHHDRHDPLYASSIRCQQKTSKYAALLEHEFLPFVVDSTGGWAPVNKRVMSLLGYEAKMCGKPSTLAWVTQQLAHSHRQSLLRCIQHRRDALLPPAAAKQIGDLAPLLPSLGGPQMTPVRCPRSPLTKPPPFHHRLGGLASRLGTTTRSN